MLVNKIRVWIHVLAHLCICSRASRQAMRRQEAGCSLPLRHAALVTPSRPQLTLGGSTPPDPLPSPGSLQDGCLVALWVTNRERHRRFIDAGASVMTMHRMASRC